MPEDELEHSKNRKWIFPAIGLVLLTAAVLALAFLFLKQDKTTVFTDTNNHVSLKYPAQLEQQALSQQDKDDKFILRLSQKNPEMLITLRYETGLSAVAAITKQEPRDLLLTNALRSYPTRFPEYKEVSQQRLAINGNEAAKLVFTYEGPTGARVLQTLVIIVKDGNTAYYLTGQAQESQSQALEGYINLMEDTFKFI